MPDKRNLERLVTAVRELSMARNLDTVMEIVRDVARELTGADGATFILREGELCYYADENAIGPLWKGRRFPMSACISGWAMIHRTAAAIEDIYADDRIPVDAYRPTFVKSLAMVPIRALDPIGAIGNYWAQQHMPTEEEMSLLQSLADITAVTIENVYIYQELEQRVKDRTLRLEAANKELEEFSYSVSHDLRAPLRAIHGYMKILQEEHAPMLNEDGKALTDRVMSNAVSMGQLIDDLLEFFRMGKKELTRSNVAVQKMVEEICAELRQQEADRNIEFRIQTLPPVEADSNLLKQVWMNLLSNAVKYTRRQKYAIVEINAEENQHEIIYAVKDNGAGFDMRYYDKLFRVFQRLHSQQEFEGTGIGLSIIARLISKHRGRVWAEAEKDKGASFYFALPVVPIAE